jgi:glycosyltransferase involved in cell wall biosynthesis
MQSKSLTIVICTHNRSELLTLALESLRGIQPVEQPWELLVVDNGSVDDTRRVAEEYATSISGLRYLHEETIGLSYARNLGWQEARGEYVAYLDDDVKVPPHWLKKAMDIIEQQAPLAFGGPCYPFYINPKPDWYKDEYGSYVKATQASFTGDVACIAGFNMCIRRDILAQEQGFPVELGMSGNRLGYAEETFLFRSLVARHGKCLYYDPEFSVYHLVRAEKTSVRWMISAKFASVRDNFPARYMIKDISIADAFVLTGKVFIGFCLYVPGLIFRDRKHYPFYQTYVHDKILPVIANAGRLYTIFHMLLAGKG